MSDTLVFVAQIVGALVVGLFGFLALKDLTRRRSSVPGPTDRARFVYHSNPSVNFTGVVREATVDDSAVPKGTLDRPTTWPVIGDLALVLEWVKSGDLYRFYHTLQRLYGPVVRLELPMGARQYVVTSLEACKEIAKGHNKFFGQDKQLMWSFAESVGAPSFLSMDGTEHRRHRRLVESVFHRRMYGSQLGLILNRFDILHQKWDKLTSSNMEFDMFDDLKLMTVDLIAAFTFGYDLEIQNDKHQDLSNAVRYTLKRNAELVFNPLALYFDPLTTVRYRKQRDQLVSTCRRLVAHRWYELSENRSDESELSAAFGDSNEKAPKRITDVDLVSLLMEARSKSQSTMTNDEIAYDAYTMMIGGQTSPPSVLTWMLYHITKNPTIEEKLIDEIEAVVGLEGDITVERLSKLHLTRAVFREIMRMYPAGVCLPRQALQDTELLGHTIEKDSFILVNLSSLCWDEKYWDEPLKFKPERFVEGTAAYERDQKLQGDGFNYFPFGAGQRHCPGLDYGSLACRLGLVSLIRRYKFEVAVEPQLRMGVAIEPLNGVHMRVRKRKL